MASPLEIDAFLRCNELPKNIELEIARSLLEAGSPVQRISHEHVQSMRSLMTAQPEDLDKRERQLFEGRVRASDVLAEAEEWPDALQLRLEVYEEAKKTLGELHAYTLSYLNGVGSIQQRSGDLDAARETFERLVALRMHIPDLATDLAYSLGRLARVFEMQKDYESAIAHYRRAVAILEEKRGNEDIETGKFLDNLGCCLLKNDDLVEAHSCFERALKIFRDLGEDCEDVIDSLQDVEDRLQD